VADFVPLACLCARRLPQMGNKVTVTSRILIGSAAAILLYLASVHLAYTFLTHKLSPTEGQLEASMKQVAPRISSEMTMWKAWLGFNVSHSMGLLLFGLIYGYMVVYRWEVLHTSYFLAGTGLLMLVGYVVLARIYWFSAPLIGVSAATVLYVVGFVFAFARR
jgi:hypothetical protein